MRERELRRRCRKLLNSLDITPPLDVEQLCARLGESRGRPIELLPYAIPVPGPFGVWLAAPRADYILYQKQTSPAHQDHIILHEIGHMIADHASDEQDDDLVTELQLGITPDSVGRALRRTSYDTDDEREAETVATIILGWASVVDVVAPNAGSSSAAPHIGSALDSRIGWL